ncbi:hypothetical protein HK097_003220, partial [Rhizophlyctis rosea]
MTHPRVTTSTVPAIEGLLETLEGETKVNSETRRRISVRKFGSRASLIRHRPDSMVNNDDDPRVSVQKLEGLMRNIRVYSVQDGLELGIGEMEGWEDLEEDEGGKQSPLREKHEDELAAGNVEPITTEPPSPSQNFSGNRSSGSAPSIASTTTVHLIRTTTKPQDPPTEPTQHLTPPTTPYRDSTMSTTSTIFLSNQLNDGSESPLPPELDYEPVRKDGITPESSFLRTPTRDSVTSVSSVSSRGTVVTMIVKDGEEVGEVNVDIGKEDPM